MSRRFAALLTLSLLGASCSSTTQDGDDGLLVGAPPEEIATTTVAAASSTSSSNSSSATSTNGTESAGDPVVRVQANEGQVEASNWLARTYMDSRSVELVWSPVGGATTYRLYRLPTAEADYDAIAVGILDGADEVFEGNEYGFIDRDVVSGTFLTYVVVAELDDGSTEPRWTEALTVDDVTPPTPVTGLTAEVTNDGVLLQWEPSTDDVEFAAYNVQVFIDGQLQYLGGGADPAQTSFLDTDPVDGLNRYVVTAVDFHGNNSTPAQVEVDA